MDEWDLYLSEYKYFQLSANYYDEEEGFKFEKDKNDLVIGYLEFIQTLEFDLYFFHVRYLYSDERLQHIDGFVKITGVALIMLQELGLLHPMQYRIE